MWPHILRICGLIYEGSAASYLEDLRLHIRRIYDYNIWWICGLISEGSVAANWEDQQQHIREAIKKKIRSNLGHCPK
jgi:hypothetical protein